MEFAKFLESILPKVGSRSDIFLVTKSFEILTQFIEELDVREVDAYNASPYVNKFKQVLSTKGNEKIKQRFCTEEDFYRLVMD